MLDFVQCLHQTLMAWLLDIDSNGKCYDAFIAQLLYFCQELCVLKVCGNNEKLDSEQVPIHSCTGYYGLESNRSYNLEHTMNKHWVSGKKRQC